MKSDTPAGRQGFTLVELVLAFGIFAMLATSTVVILSATLRSTARAAVAAKVRNEGEYLMESISQLTRYSKDVSCVGTTELDVSTATYLPLAKITCSGTTIASNSAQISSREVEISGCAFTCSPTDTNPTQVNVSFSIKDLNDVITPLTFDTNIVLRNAQ